MGRRKLTQKLVSFTENSPEFHEATLDIENGWSIVSLMKNNNYYVGIMEYNDSNEDVVYIPPRKKIKISASSG